jgi:hypothetical protein
MERDEECCTPDIFLSKDVNYQGKKRGEMWITYIAIVGHITER